MFTISIMKLVDNGLVYKWKRHYQPFDMCSHLNEKRRATLHPASITVSHVTRGQCHT